jgi:hypothetical protein
MDQLFQALFYPLNAFVSERRERQIQMQQEYKLLLSQTITKRIHTKPTTPTKPNGSEIEEDASLKIGEEIMNFMHTHHPPLINDMKKLCSEIVHKIVPEPEEDLLWLLRMILFHCYRVMNQQCFSFSLPLLILCFKFQFARVNTYQDV